MLGRQGGRRVFVRSSRKPEFFTGMNLIFKNMRRAPAKLHYELEKDLPGLEILFADENLSAETLWKDGGDFRLLIADKARRKKIDREITQATDAVMEDGEGGEESNEKVREIQQKREYDSYTWFKFEAGRLNGPANQPDQAAFLPARDGFAVRPSYGQWKAKAPGVEVRTDATGLHLISAGKLTKIQSGVYESPVVAGNGRWTIATKFSDKDEGISLVRVNLLTQKELLVKLNEYPIGKAVANVPSKNRVLVTESYYSQEEDNDTESGNYYWLDAETGAVQPAVGELRPLVQQTFRSLQPSANPFEFWAAIPDAAKKETEIGIYNSKTLSFKPTLKIPKIEFDSMDMWVDGPAGKVYFVYEGHLLALPLRRSLKPL